MEEVAEAKLVSASPLRDREREDLLLRPLTTELRVLGTYAAAL